jgi:hypothetical protein
MMTIFEGKKIREKLGTWEQDDLDRLIREAAVIRNTGERIKFLSSSFLGLGYQEGTLTGNFRTPEVFTVDLSGVDCFTFLDYVEAMRLSDSYEGFLQRLRQVRYCDGKVSFLNRKHFFTDWFSCGHPTVSDVTKKIGGGKVRTRLKTLNLKEDGILLLPGLTPVHRRIQFLPAEEIDHPEISVLQTGDYAGLYSPLQGLDVSHVGIVIRKTKRVYLRHASSNKNYRKVIDQEFREYMKGKPGLIILRPSDKGEVKASA